MKGPRDRGRTLHNNTNAYHAGVITSTCTKEKTLTTVILLEQDVLLYWNLSPFMSALGSYKTDSRWCAAKLDKRNVSLIKQKKNKTPSTSCVWAHRAACCFSAVCKIALFILGERENAESTEHSSTGRRTGWKRPHLRGLEYVHACVCEFTQRRRCLQMSCPRAVWQRTPHLTAEWSGEAECVCV